MSNNDPKILSPMSDIIFKLLMGSENSKELLTDFLLAVLGLSADEYDDIIIQNPFILPEYKGDKLGILDVRLKLKSGKILHIEVQVNPMPAMESRIIFYLSKLITEQIGESDQYEKIKPVVSIIITGHTLIKENNKYHHHFGLYDVDNNVLLTDAIAIHTLEVPKARKLSEDTQKAELFNWVKFFDVKTEEELDMLAQRSKSMRRAVLRLRELSADEKARELYEARVKEQRDIISREQGAKKEGKKEGKKEAALNIAKNALDRGMSIADVVVITGLTHEEVEGLKKADKKLTQ